MNSPNVIIKDSKIRFEKKNRFNVLYFRLNWIEHIKNEEFGN